MTWCRRRSVPFKYSHKLETKSVRAPLKVTSALFSCKARVGHWCDYCNWFMASRVNCPGLLETPGKFVSFCAMSNSDVWDPKLLLITFWFLWMVQNVLDVCRDSIWHLCISVFWWISLPLLSQVWKAMWAVKWMPELEQPTETRR